MKKVLIVTYYWPPAGGPGVQRVLKFTKYLPHFGWKPLILTVKDGEFPAIDQSLITDIPDAAEVFKAESLEPGMLYKRFLGMNPEDKIPVSVLAEPAKNWKQSLAAWIRLNLFIPDAKRGWIPMGIREGSRIIRSHKPDLIFSSSPPPTVHLIAKKLAQKSGLPWVADFRDPWTDIHYYEDQPRMVLAKWLDARYEQTVLDKADRITCISRLDIELDFEKKISPEKCVNIPNGYDEDDFRDLNFSASSDQRFILMHLGAVGKERNPSNLLLAIKGLYENNIITKHAFCLRFLGNVEATLKQEVTNAGIDDLVEFMDYLPHKKALEAIRHATVMLLLITQSKKNRRILPGKTFEYIRTGKPVLAMGPEDGEVARIIAETGSGKTIDYGDEEKIYAALLDLYSKWQENEPIKTADKALIQRFSRKQLTHDLVTQFEILIHG